MDEIFLDIWNVVIDKVGMVNAIAIFIVGIAAAWIIKNTVFRGKETQHIQKSEKTQYHVTENMGGIYSQLDNPTIINDHHKTEQHYHYSYYQQDEVQIELSDCIKSSNDKLAWEPCMPDDASRFFPSLSIKNWEFYISESFYSNLTTKELVYSILAVEKENPSLSLSRQKRKAMCVLITKNDNSIIAMHPSKDNKAEEEDMLDYYILTNHPNKGKESVYPFSHEFYETYKALLRIREENARKRLDAFMKKKHEEEDLS